MAWLMVSTFGYALALPFLQDDRTITAPSSQTATSLQRAVPPSGIVTIW